MSSDTYAGGPSGAGKDVEEAKLELSLTEDVNSSVGVSSD